MKYNNFLFAGFLILLFSMVFAASPVFTGPIIASREYIVLSDRNYYDFNVKWSSGLVTDADGDLNELSCEYSVNDGFTWNTLMPDSNYDPVTLRCNVDLNYEWGNSGYSQIRFRIKDDAENLTTSADRNWYLDNTAPTTVGTFNDVTQITLTATDKGTPAASGVGVKAIYYRVDTGAWVSATTTSSVVVSVTTPGNHHIYFYSTDNFDNNELRDNLSGVVWDKPFTVPGISPTGGTCSLLNIMIMALAAALLLSLIYAAFNVLTDGFNSQVFIGLTVSAIMFIIILIVIGAFNSVICLV